MFYTREILEANDACREGLVFWFLNKLDLIDIDLSKVEGDYKSYINWLKTSINRCEYDSEGNIIKKTRPKGGCISIRFRGQYN